MVSPVADRLKVVALNIVSAAGGAGWAIAADIATVVVMARPRAAARIRVFIDISSPGSDARPSQFPHERKL